jgi:hypothetical protein
LKLQSPEHGYAQILRSGINREDRVRVIRHGVGLKN